MLDPVQALAGEVDHYQDFLARLPELLNEMDSGELVKRLAQQVFQARGAGDATDEG